MSHYYIFNEPGVIPGTWASCRVDVADDGTYALSPLKRHPNFEAVEANVATAEEVAKAAPEQTSSKGSPA